MKKELSGFQLFLICMVLPVPASFLFVVWMFAVFDGDPSKDLAGNMIDTFEPRTNSSYCHSKVEKETGVDRKLISTSLLNPDEDGNILVTVNESFSKNVETVNYDCVVDDDMNVVITLVENNSGS